MTEKPAHYFSPVCTEDALPGMGITRFLPHGLQLRVQFQRDHMADSSNHILAGKCKDSLVFFTPFRQKQDRMRLTPDIGYLVHGHMFIRSESMERAARWAKAEQAKGNKEATAESMLEAKVNLTTGYLKDEWCYLHAIVDLVLETDSLNNSVLFRKELHGLPSHDKAAVTDSLNKAARDLLSRPVDDLNPHMQPERLLFAITGEPSEWSNNV